MRLTHFDGEGESTDGGCEKKETMREATATGTIRVSRDVYDDIEAGSVERGRSFCSHGTCGDHGSKRTADLIPMCHILPITNSSGLKKNPQKQEIPCFCTVKVTGKTGVEMGSPDGSQRGASDNL